VLPGKNESFFAIGGDSLAWARMTAMLESEMGVDVRLLAPPLLLASPTITVFDGCGPPASDGFARVRGWMRLYWMEGMVALLLLSGRGARCHVICAHSRAYWDNPLLFCATRRWDPTAGPAAFEELIQGFVDYVIQTQPPGAMGGHCFGGILAFECARRFGSSRMAGSVGRAVRYGGAGLSEGFQTLEAIFEVGS